MKKLVTIILASGFLFLTNLNAQTAAQAYWGLYADTVVTVTGDVEAADQFLSPPLSILDFNGSSFGAAERIWYGGEVWPNDAAPNFDQYVEFKVSPKAGNTLHVDSVVIPMACYGTRSYMFANTYWDNNPEFSTKHMLDTSTVPLNDMRDSAVFARRFEINTDINDGQTFYLRVYPWYGTDGGTTKYVCFSDVVITGTTTAATALNKDKQLPTEFSLRQNYPNPFNPTTTIQFSVPESGTYSLKVFNLLGQEVAELINGKLSTGIHNVSFDAVNLPSGMYIYKLTGAGMNLSRKMMVLK